jgi:two-component system NarL family sensor kinase
VSRLVSRTLDFLTSEPLRIRSTLRLVLIVLIALLVENTRVEHRNEAVFKTVLASYAIGSVLWLIFILIRPSRPWYPWVSTFADVAVVIALCIASGPATISLFPIFFLLPISVAFLDSPLLTGVLGLSASFGYLLAWAAYATQEQKMGMTIPAVVYVQVGCLLWLTAATTALSFTLARRRARVLGLLDVRRRLIAETMRADLAARLDLDELRENSTPEVYDRLDAALRETVTELRATVATLHPQVLTQLGLTAAIRDLAQRYEQRWGTPVNADLDEVGHPAAQALIHRAARELLSNAHKHSRATNLEVSLHSRSGSTVLQVADDGIGFDPAILARRVSEGHIGLASLVVAVEATGGAMDFAERPGGGTLVTVTVPDELNED